MSEGLKAVRQWVSASGGACDARLGHGVILGEAGSLFRAAVGRPRRAALVTATTDEELVELTRRELSSEGFEVAGITLSETGEMRCLSEATQLVDSLAQAGITADDPCVTPRRAWAGGGTAGRDGPGCPGRTGPGHHDPSRERRVRGQQLVVEIRQQEQHLCGIRRDEFCRADHGNAACGHAAPLLGG